MKSVRRQIQDKLCQKILQRSAVTKHFFLEVMATVHYCLNLPLAHGLTLVICLLPEKCVQTKPCLVLQGFMVLDLGLRASARRICLPDLEGREKKENILLTLCGPFHNCTSIPSCKNFSFVPSLLLSSTYNLIIHCLSFIKDFAHQYNLFPLQLLNIILASLHAPIDQGFSIYRF